MFYSLLVPRNIDITYQYESELILDVGQIVVINFNNKLTIAVVMSHDNEKQFKELKKIDSATEYRISPNQIKFLKFFAEYNLQKSGNVLKMMLNNDITKTNTKKLSLKQKSDENFFSPTLSSEQEEIFQKVFSKNNFHVFALEGVTGSGKTEIYIKLIIEKLQQNKQCLLLLPEIALTDQICARFKQYGISPSVYTSFTTPAQKREIWKAVAKNECNFVIGTRSSLFLPFQNLGIIIIDEEHDASYKQEENPIYNARDMAVVLAKINNIPILLGSATPSIETFYNTTIGNYEHLLLTKRFSGTELPEFELIPKQQNELFSEKTLLEIQNTLDKGEQVLIYFNKRGYNLISKCTSCLKILECPFCSSYLVKHPFKGVYECHYCFYQLKIDDTCPYCKCEHSIESFIDGIEKVAEVVQEKFPGYSIGIASSDTFTTLNKINDFLENVRNDKFNIIIGTQIIAKGHHFSNLTLVCILDLEAIIKSPDIRSLEKAYQFVNQISGRAGREQKKGKVLVQSSLQNFDINLILDRNKFFNFELENRKKFNLPPFKRLTSIIVSNKNPKSAENKAFDIVSDLSFINGINVLGPIPAPIYKISGKYRWRILIRYDRNFSIQKILKTRKFTFDIDVKIDIDPISFF